MAATKKRPPYASTVDLDTFFDKIRGLSDPETVTSKWVATYKLAASQPEGLVGALKWLNVIDRQGKSQGVWTDLRTHKRAETLERLVEEAYADVFNQIDVPEADRQALEGAFIHAYGSGNTVRPIACFLALCRHAGIETKAAVRQASRSATIPAAQTASVRADGAAPRSQSTPQPKRAAADRHGGIAVTLNVEIPADWSDAQVRQRIELVRRAISGT